MGAPDQAQPRILLELGAGVGDVEVAHGQLADPVDRTEGRVVGALHGQLVRVVAEGGAGRVEDGVVLPAPQPQHDLTRDRRADPALQRLAQHHRLGVQPPTLVHQPAQPTALVVVVRDGVLVVDRVDEALEPDVQQRHTRGLVDPAALRLDDPVLDLVGHAQPVAAADRVGLEDQVHGARELLAVDGDRPSPLVADGHVLGEDVDLRVPEPDAHDRVDRLEAGVEVFEGLGLVRRPPDVRVRRVSLLGAVPVREAVLEQPLGHLLAAAELGDEVGVEPRLVDAQLRVGQQSVAVEPLDVVALERRAVAPDVDAVLEHGAHQHGARDRPADRRGVEVGATTAADVEGAAGQGGQPLLDQRQLAVDVPRDLGAVLDGPVGHTGDVALVVLPDVGGVGAGHRALLTHPGDRDRGVEATGEGDADALADGEAGQDLAHMTSIADQCIFMHRGGWRRLSRPGRSRPRCRR